MDFEKDYYSVLGVDKKATDEEISSAYRKLMLKWHPDRFASESKEKQEEANRKSAEINEAHDILSDSEKRREYDMYRENGGRIHGMRNPWANASGMGGFGFGGNFNMFGGNFGGFGFGGNGFSGFQPKNAERNPQKGKRISIHVELPFEDFFFGCSKTLDIKVHSRCQHCNGGIIGDAPKFEKCSRCDGQGITIERHCGAMLEVVQSICPVCKGTGKVLSNACKECNGTSISGIRTQSVEFKIPEDTRNTYSKTYEGVGHAGMYGGDNGDITIDASISDSGMFYPSGGNNVATLHFVNVFKFMSGGYDTIMTPYGKKTILLPSGMEDGHVERFPGMGLKSSTPNEPDGDLYVTFKIDFPKNIRDEDVKKMISDISDRLGHDSSCFSEVDAENKYVQEYLGKLKNRRG